MLLPLDCLLIIHGRFIPFEKSKKIISDLEKVLYVLPVLSLVCYADYLKHVTVVVVIMLCCSGVGGLSY
jgi:hypothetical protein